MIGRYFIYIAILLFAGLLGILYNEYTTGLFFVCVLIYPVTAWAELMLHRFFLSWDCAFLNGEAAKEREVYDVLTLEKGRTAWLQHRIRNASPLPVWNADVRSVVQNGGTGQETVRQKQLELPPFATGQVLLPYLMEHYGVYRIKKQRLRSMDPFHIVRFRMSVRDTGVIFCRPSPSTGIGDAAAPDVSELARILEYLEASDRRQGEESCDVQEIRPFQPGDRWNRIHFRLTEKFGEWMVKVMEREEKPSLLLILEREAGDPDGQDRCMEFFCRTAELLLTAGAGFDVFYRQDGTEAEEAHTVNDAEAFEAELFGILDKPCGMPPAGEPFCPSVLLSGYDLVCRIRKEGIVPERKGGGLL